jgi:hypothetical protein
VKIYNFLPHLLDCLRGWDKLPTERQFGEYLKPMDELLRPMLEDFEGRFGGGMYPVLEGLNWESYRTEALALDPAGEEARLKKHIAAVEKLLGVTLQGEAMLFGAFTVMDGYARFNLGTHRVYLGADESHGRGAYLDVLYSHELTHAAREPLPEVWAGFGLDPKTMTHDDFTEKIPVIEHLMNEGFACLVSELLNPNEPASHYCYQTDDSLEQIMQHGPAVDRAVHAQIGAPDGDYGMLYDTSRYVPPVARYAHYVWAWQWTKHLLKGPFKNDPRRLLHACAKDWIEDALAFRLPKEL